MSRSREKLEVEKERKDSRKGSHKQPMTPTSRKKIEGRSSPNPLSPQSSGTVEYTFEELADLIRQTALEEKVCNSEFE